MVTKTGGQYRRRFCLPKLPQISSPARKASRRRFLREFLPPSQSPSPPQLNGLPLFQCSVYWIIFPKRRSYLALTTDSTAASEAENENDEDDNVTPLLGASPKFRPKPARTCPGQFWCVEKRVGWGGVGLLEIDSFPIF